jgi:hypothetical protein
MVIYSQNIDQVMVIYSQNIDQVMVIYSQNIDQVMVIKRRFAWDSHVGDGNGDVARLKRCVAWLRDQSTDSLSNGNLHAHALLHTHKA